MNRIVSHCGAAAVGAALVAVLFGIPQQLKLDLHRAAAIRSAAREENMSKQLSAALDISGKMEFLGIKADSAADHCRAAEGVAAELLELAKKRVSDKRQDVSVKPKRPVEQPNDERSAPNCAVAAASLSAEDGKSFGQAMLDAHNTFRQQEGVPELRWSESLAVQAQAWADHLAPECKMQHSGTGYGENISFAGPIIWTSGKREEQRVPPDHVVQSWYEEQQWYDHTTGQCSAPAKDSCGHYTQVVWKDTQELGCARVTCPSKGQIWVCNYFPAGNVAGQKPH